MNMFESYRYLLMTTDPVHIGTGGYRLGRVDNSIVREPGAHIPKIPGTSLHGAARSYAARLYADPHSAGQSHKAAKHIATNPVCYTFGYVQETDTGNNDRETKGYSGIVNISDALVLFFPVHSMVGPVWVSTVQRLADANIGVQSVPALDAWANDKVYCTWSRSEPLNLGWLMLNVQQEHVAQITPPPAWANEQRWLAIKDRIVLVHPELFSHIVNSNLEVRTSVSIDPERGAASEGALFTYEALPRATFLTMEVIIDDYRQTFPDEERLQQWLNQPPNEREKKWGWREEWVKEALEERNRLQVQWKRPADVVDAGLGLIAWLGVGGMGTRGFGRMAVAGKWEVQA
jgi:CRISPR-associated protein Cmr4